MGTRRRARENALKVLYARDVGKHTARQALQSFWDYFEDPDDGSDFTDMLVLGTDEHIEEAKRGVESKHGLLKALVVEKLGTGGAKTKLRIVIDEGKNRHIRRLFGAMKDPKFGTPLKVLELKRVSIGSFGLDIKSGEWRFLTNDEEKILLR